MLDRAGRVALALWTSSPEQQRALDRLLLSALVEQGAPGIRPLSLNHIVEILKYPTVSEDLLEALVRAAGAPGRVRGSRVPVGAVVEQLTATLTEVEIAGLQQNLWVASGSGS